MMKFQYLPAAALIVSVWPSLSLAQPCSSLDELRWMLGEWITDQAETVVRETWTKVSARTFDGAGETVLKASRKRQSGESLLLAEMSGEVFYIAKVAHNALPVAFKLVGCSETTALFRNTDHDFPKQLEYQRKGEDSLIVAVSDGGSNGFTLGLARKSDR